jgi:hypothetical protein
MLLDADCILFHKLYADCAFIYKLNADCVIYPVVMDELTRMSLLWTLVAMGR